MEILELLGYALVAFPYVVAFLLAVGLVALVLGLYRHPTVAVVAILAMAVWQGAAYRAIALRLGILVYPQDILFTCLAMVVILRLLTIKGTVAALPRSLLVLLGLLLFSFTLGLARHGKPAGVEFRSDFYFWTACLYFLTFRPDEAWLNRMMTWWSVAAFLLCLVVWYRWTADAFNLTWVDPIWRYADPTGVLFRRVAPAQVAFMLGLAVLISMARLSAGHARAAHYLLMPALVLTVVVLQHRSVWVATLLPVLLLLVTVRSTRRHSGGSPAVAALIAMVAVIALLGSGRLGTVSESVTQQAVNATSTTGGTFVSRVEGWKELLNSWVHSGPVGLALGQPYGSGVTRHQGANWGGVVIMYAPHNYFITLLLRTGPFGLLALCALLWRLLSYGMVPSSTETSFSRPLIAAIALALLLFCIPYSPSFESSVLVGAALCCARREPRRDHEAAAHGLRPVAGRYGRKAWPATASRGVPTLPRRPSV